MKRIATPMIGGVVTSTVMELAVYPSSSTSGAPVPSAPLVASTIKPLHLMVAQGIRSPKGLI